jgi:hypothetical protein
MLNKAFMRHLVTIIGHFLRIVKPICSAHLYRLLNKLRPILVLIPMKLRLCKTKYLVAPHLLKPTKMLTFASQ